MGLFRLRQRLDEDRCGSVVHEGGLVLSGNTQMCDRTGQRHTSMILITLEL